MKRQKENSLENITWSKLGKQNIQAKKVYSIIKLDRGHAGMKFTRDTTICFNSKEEIDRIITLDSGNDGKFDIDRINENHCQIGKKRL